MWFLLDDFSKVDNYNNGILIFNQQGQMGLSFQGPKGDKVSTLYFGTFLFKNHSFKYNRDSASGPTLGPLYTIVTVFCMFLSLFVFSLKCTARIH